MQQDCQLSLVKNLARSRAYSPPPNENPVLGALALAVDPKRPPPVAGADPNAGVAEGFEPKAGAGELFAPNPPIVYGMISSRLSRTRADLARDRDEEAGPPCIPALSPSTLATVDENSSPNPVFWAGC